MIELLCSIIKCPKLIDEKCQVYPIEGMKFRTKLDYCPIIARGIVEPMKKKVGRVRQGQQKQKGKKR